MNKKILYSIIGTLLIINLIILFKLIKFEKDTRIKLDQSSITESILRDEISNIYLNVDEKLKKQGSILDSYDLTIEDKLNTENFTVPVTVTITPKEYTEGLTASLDINNKIINMEKKGASFTIKTDSYIFNNLNIKVIIEQDGIQKTETLEEEVDLKSKFILSTMNGNFNGKIKNIKDSNKFKINGQFHLNFGYNDLLTIDGVIQNNIKKISIIKEKNGNIIGEESKADVTGEGFVSFATVEIDEDFNLEKGDKLKIYARIEDSYGLTYKFTISNYELDNNGNPIDTYYQGMQNDLIEVSDKEGNIINNMPRYNY